MATPDQLIQADADSPEETTRRGKPDAEPAFTSTPKYADPFDHSQSAPTTSDDVGGWFRRKAEWVRQHPAAAAGILFPPVAPALAAESYTDNKLSPPQAPEEKPRGPVDLTRLQEAYKQRGELPDFPQDTGEVPAQYKQPASGGGGGGGGASSGPSGFERQLAADYDEQLGGMAEESAARDNAAQQQAGALRGLAEEKRGYAQESGQQAANNAASARQHLDMIGALAADYANGHIDKDKWWKDKNVPQKIATVLGAMFMGYSGGAKSAADFINGQINRSISLQQEEMKQKGRALYEADNLFNNFLKVSANEQEAYDKTRAAMLDASMTEVAAVSAEAKSPIEKAQMKQFMAALKMQRDTVLAKLGATRAAAGAAAQQSQQGWLSVDPKTLITGPGGQQFIIQNSQLGDDVTNALTALQTIKGLIKQGSQLVQSRGGLDYLPYSSNIQQGESIDSSMVEALSKLASARGVPPNLAHTIKEQLPQFGSRAAGIEMPKAEAMNRYLDERAGEIITRAGAIPVESRIAGGAGKKAGELTYYVRPGVTKPQGQEVENKRQYGSFKAGQ